MPLPRVVARLNKRYTNRFIEPVVRRFSGFAVVHHTGRQTGNRYRTPVLAFDTETDSESDGTSTLLVALTYGPGADWAQNVLRGGGAIRRKSGSELAIAAASIVGRDVAWPHLPWIVRTALRLLRVNDFMALEITRAR